MKRGESDEEIWECPQEFKQSAVVPAKWNDRGWSSDDGSGLLPSSLAAFERDDEAHSHVKKGDIAILRFLQALETVEADLWLQYSELGGTQDNEVSGPSKTGNPDYTAALTILDGDMPQYVHDNTDDEISHEAFLSNYLKSKGAEPFDLTPFKVLPSSQADGADKTAARLTNLTQLTIDTSFWSRYRSITNPDFDLGAPFVQAVPSLNVGQHTAIPRTNNDTAGSDPSNPPSSISTHLQAIAFTARFHRVHRARRHQPVSDTGSAGEQSRSAANFTEHRPERDDALPNLAGQGRQRLGYHRHGHGLPRFYRSHSYLFGAVAGQGRN